MPNPATSNHTTASPAAGPVRPAAEFQVCDDAGAVEIRQDNTGRIYVPGRATPIGGGGGGGVLENQIR